MKNNKPKISQKKIRKKLSNKIHSKDIESLSDLDQIINKCRIIKRKDESR